MCLLVLVHYHNARLAQPKHGARVSATHMHGLARPVGLVLEALPHKIDLEVAFEKCIALPAAAESTPCGKECR